MRPKQLTDKLLDNIHCLLKIWITDTWKPYTNLMPALAAMLHMREDMPEDTFQTALILRLAALELERKSLLAVYVTVDGSIFVRAPFGYCLANDVDPSSLADELANAFQHEWWLLNEDTMLRVGEILRLHGIDWENRFQLQRLLDGLTRMQYLELRRRSDQLEFKLGLRFWERKDRFCK